MRCNICNSIVEEKWRFCAACGTNLAGSPNKTDIIAEKAVETSILSALQGMGISGFAIRAVPSALREQKKYSKRQPQNNFLQTPNKEITVVEPKTDITRLPGRIIVDADLPEVKSGNNIKIMLLGESIEIRAVAPEKMYLKIMHIPKNMRLAGSSFVEGKLKIALGECMRARV